ncbi:MAG: putative lipopolysaccharide heptosyltransferase III [Geobacteraceae bacterium]|nr:putative lipopolysaccharide heptosyltransferase III [Geobacteraceae bacterium]
MTDQNDIRSILVIKQLNIGDVLLTSPLFANLRLHYPGARICALVYAGTEAMLTDNPDIDHIYTCNRSSRQESKVHRLRSEFRQLCEIRKERFDLAINLTVGDRGAIAAFASGARFRIGVESQGRGFRGKDRFFTSLLPPHASTMHTVDQNLICLSALGKKVIHKKVSFYFPDAVRDSILLRLRTHGLEPYRFFHAHVTSRWMFKTMPAEKMAYLLDTFFERTGLPAVLESAPVQKELDYMHSVLACCRHPHVTLEGDVSLKELGALSALSCFHVGIDSAPMHIAAAVGVPTLGIFGPLPVTCWGPWDNLLCVSPYTASRGVQCSGRNIALQSDKSCVPCGRAGCNDSKISECLNFSLKELDAVIDRFLECLRSETDQP